MTVGSTIGLPPTPPARYACISDPHILLEMTHQDAIGLQYGQSDGLYAHSLLLKEKTGRVRGRTEGSDLRRLKVDAIMALGHDAEPRLKHCMDNL